MIYRDEASSSIVVRNFGERLVSSVTMFSGSEALHDPVHVAAGTAVLLRVPTEDDLPAEDQLFVTFADAQGIRWRKYSNRRAERVYGPISV